MTTQEFTHGVAWVLLQVLGQDKTEAELQAAYEEAIRLLFATEAGDEEAAAMVLEAGRNFQATAQLHVEAAKRRASKLN